MHAYFAANQKRKSYYKLLSGEDDYAMADAFGELLHRASRFDFIDGRLRETGLEKDPESPLFPAAIRKTGKLSRRSLVRTDAGDMLKRRLKQAGLPAHYSPHSFRATGITNFLENDGTLEAAQRIAGHADSRTTKLYDRRGQKVLLEDMERIRY